MNPSKTERIDVRASAQVKPLLQDAARASHKNVSEFLLDAGLAAAAQTYVCCRDEGVVGYYSLAVGSVDPQAAPARVTKGLARHPVPVMILARLAVDRGHQGHGLGRALLKDALLRTAQAADIAGIRCLLVHAKDDAARRWYPSWDFESSPSDPHHLVLMLKDLRKLLS